MHLSDYSPSTARFVATTATRLRAWSRKGERRHLARHYRGMSDHSLADIGFSRTQIDFQVFGDDDRR